MKKNKVKLFLFVLIILIFGKEEVKSMIKRLKPLKLTSLANIYDITGIGKKNHIAGINGSGKFIVIKISKNEIITVKNAAGIFPPADGMEVNSDNEYNFVWNTRGRGFYATDIDTKMKGHCVASNDANDKIVNCQLIDPENKIFIIELSIIDNDTWGIAGFKYVLYDLKMDNIIYTSNLYSGDIYRFNKDILFFGKLKSENGKYLSWSIRDFSLNKKDGNKLTEELNKFHINCWSQSKTLTIKNRMMIGTNRVNGETVYYTVRWDEKFEDIKIEPIILQRPFGNFLDEAFEFSQDGKWVKTLRIPFSEGKDMPWELIIYHVSDIYPQGLSMPIFCGASMESTPGAFMDHEEWGMCYVQLIGTNTLYVYKLNEGLKLMAENAKELLK